MCIRDRFLLISSVLNVGLDLWFIAGVGKMCIRDRLCTAGVYSGEYLPQPLDLGARVVPQGQQTGVRQRQLQRQIPCLSLIHI